MAEGSGIFLDIFSRLNLASVETALTACRTAMREGGQAAGRDLDEGINAGVRGAEAGFRSLTETSATAYRDMERGLAQLQVAEARINDLRARNFKSTADSMIAAQRELDASIANTQKLIEASRLVDPLGIAGRGRSAPDRGGVIPDRVARAGRVVGAGAALATGGALIEGGRVAADTGRNMQQVRAFHPGETQNYINRQTQSIYQMATQVPFSPQELSKVYQDIENHGYTGQAALDMLSTAAKTATSTGAGLKDTTDGLMTSVKDFGIQAELQSSNLEDYKKGLADLNQMAGQLVITFGNMKGVNPDELFRSFGSVEPIAAQYLKNMPGPQQSANVNAMLALLAQTGIGPEQGAHNVSRVMSSLGAISPGSKMYSMLNQLGLNPQAVMATQSSQGPFAALQMIQQAIASRTDQNGMVNIGWRYNSDEISGLAQQDYSQLSDQAKQFVDSHPEIGKGLATFKTKKELTESGVSGNDAQDILTYAQWQTKLHGPNRFTKQGEPTSVTPGQVFQLMFGTGDIARTASNLGTNAAEGSQLVQQFTSAGSGALTGAFKDMMSTIPTQWKQLGSSLQGLAGELGTHVIPAATHFVSGLNGAADWLSRNKDTLHALEAATAALAAAWGASKLINLFRDLQPAVTLLTKGASNLGQMMSDRLPTQVAGLGTAAQTTGDEIKSSGIGTALKTAASNVSSAFSKGALTLAIAQTVGGALDASGLPTPGDITSHHPGASTNSLPSWLQDPQWLQGIGKYFNMYKPDGKARGGIVGYKGGGLTSPFSQPLMNVADQGVDTVLGMLPNGTPVGLRGGEGILTPEAVSALGGKAGIDALNKNPWSDPLKVGSSFYGSFAKGVAKYSPFGKYLEATSQTLDSLEQERENAAKENVKGGKEFNQMLRALGRAEGYRPDGEPYAHGGHGRYGGSYGGDAIGSGNSNVMAAIGGAYWQSGFPASQFGDLKWIISHESGFNPNARNPKSGAYGLGQFLGHESDKYAALGAYSGDPSQETNAMLAYIRDRYGDPAHAKSFWQSHGWYSKGGVVGFSGGGVTPPQSPPPPDPGGPQVVSVPKAPQQYHTVPSNGPQQKAPQQPKQPPTPQRQPSPPSHGDKVPNTFTPPGTKPGQYASPNEGRDLKENPSRPAGTNNTSKGFGVQGGILGTAEQAATMAASMGANAVAPGSGAAASQAMNMGFQLANRAMGYAGQLAGIGIEGLMETFLPNNSALGDPTNNILGKMAMGIAGAHPSPKNTAGDSAMKLKPKENLDEGAMAGKQMPGLTMNIQELHNHTGDHQETKNAVNQGFAMAAFKG